MQKPVYRSVDINWPTVLGFDLIVILLFGVLGLGDYAMMTPQMRADIGFVLFDPIVICLFVLLIFIPFSSIVQMSVLPERISLRKTFGLVHFTIRTGQIVSVQPSPHAAEYYLGSLLDFARGGPPQLMVTTGYLQPSLEWRYFAWSPNLRGVMIQTQNRKYFVTCRDPEAAVKAIRDAFGIPDLPITPPPPWND
jgi:hypothetical protein